MPRTSTYDGLCRSCKNDPDCTFPRVRSRPVTQCAEYVAYEPQPTRASRRRAQGTVNPGWPSGDSAEKAREMGLCRTCENRETCTFPGARNRVWGCLEYE